MAALPRNIWKIDWEMSLYDLKTAHLLFILYTVLCVCVYIYIYIYTRANIRTK